MEAPDGIILKSLYTEKDLENLSLHSFLDYHLLRGPKATMYTGKPWTIRQYAGFLLLKNQINFIKIV